MSPKFINKTRGLCGTFNKIQHDDFKTPEETIDTNALTFSNAWNLDLTCPGEHHKMRHPCDMQVQKQKAAKKKCYYLKLFPFTQCHHIVDPALYIKACQYDFCRNADSARGLCTSVASYTKECADQGVVIEWRNSNLLPECGKFYLCLWFFYIAFPENTGQTIWNQSEWIPHFETMWNFTFFYIF